MYRNAEEVKRLATEITGTAKAKALEIGDLEAYALTIDRVAYALRLEYDRVADILNGKS